ncbi:phosphoribosylanthranilate isomerase [Paenibacillus sinopodophylli]|uniref:phosphoribosylanthranilate isomerase n=1 Tax=Paenibacillus sinopodophylli TaxID=1837342 RepID=UPI00110D1FA1|nr:phosphoribosylanthranilate isomerase [Paenibacillus sinopodophylli]
MSRSPRIKICGLMDTRTIQAMDGLPIHEIGFVFAPSKRQVAGAEAALLVAEAKLLNGADGVRPLTVGVFVNEAFDSLRAILAETQLDVAQLHGSEPPEYCKAVRDKLNVQVWKVFSMKKEQEDNTPVAAIVRLSPYRADIDVVLIDAPGGGTGQTFDWDAINEYQQAAEELGIPLYVAGGLHEGNVQELLSSYAPTGIDVSSGVETDGRKDIEKIRLFVRRVREA